MKKLLILSMVILGTVSFARDFEYNEKRDIVKPMEENVERMSRMNSEDSMFESKIVDENFKKYEEFHNQLDRSDRGENSER